MNKKITAAILAAMVLVFGACNTAEETLPGEEIIGEEIVESASQTPDMNQGEQEVTDSEEAEVAASGYLDVEYNYFADFYGDGITEAYGHYNTICLNTQEYPALTAAVEAYNQTHAEEKQSYLDELGEWAAEEYKEYGEEMFMGPFVAESDMYLRRADTQVLSVVEACYSYEGGAHGNSYYESVNFDVLTGEEIGLEAVIKDMDSLPGILAAELEGKYNDLTFWTEDLTSLLQEYIMPTDADYTPEFTWTLDYEGVTFYFSDYELGSYADGRQEVMISYSEYPQILESKYFADVEDNYVVALLDNWAGTDMDINGDGVTDYFSIHKNYSVDTDMCESFDVTVNGNTFTQHVYFFDLWSYFVKANGKNYLYVQRRAESDFESVSVFEITENSVEYVGDFANSLENFTNSLNFGVSKRMDLLSTYYAVADCTVGEDGLPVEKNDVYRITAEVMLTSTAAIPAELVNEAGELSGEMYEFPVGTVFRFVATDGTTYVDVQADDGQRCRFYTTSDWPPTVNELNAESCFEMLWYAG